MTHLGVNLVGEIQWRRPVRHIHHVPLGREDVDAVAAHVTAELIHQPMAVTQLLLPLDHLAQPVDLRFIGSLGTAIVRPLVAPVGTNTQFRILVHLMGADLHLHGLALGPDHGRVQGLVAVFLGVGDVIVKFVRNMAPEPVHHPDGRIAVAHFGNQHTQGPDVVDLREVDPLAPHLSPDAVDVLGAAGHLRLNARIAQCLLEAVRHTPDIGIPVHALLIQKLGNLLVGGLVQVAEGQIFQFPLDVANAQPVGQRRVDVEHLAGDAQPLLGRRVLDRPDGTGPFRQLDQGHTHVIHHGYEHAADVVLLPLGLPQHIAFEGAMQRGDGGHPQDAIDQFRYGLTELAGDFLQGHAFLTHGAIEHGRHQGFPVQTQFGQDLRHLQTGLEAAGPGRPLAILADRLAVNRQTAPTGPDQGIRVIQRVLGIDVVYPGADVHPAIRGADVVFADLHHQGDSRSNRAMDSTWAVCGNMSMIPALTRRYPLATRIPASRARVAGLHET